MLKVSCPGLCGELFQLVYNHQEWLLTYNIDLKTEITMQRSSENIGFKELSKIDAAREYVLPNQCVAISKRSQVPIGKGCSSSSADLLASIQAMALLKQVHMTVEEMTKVAAKIEPTDSVGFCKWTVMNPLTGEIFEQFDFTEELYVYMLEPVEHIDTIALERMTANVNYDQKQSGVIFEAMLDALRQKNVEKIGKLATQSAILNEKRLHKPYFKALCDFVTCNHLLGLNVAHSGTVVGLLLNYQQACRIAVIEQKIKSEVFSTYYQKRRLCKIIYEGVTVVDKGV